MKKWQKLVIVIAVIVGIGVNLAAHNSNRTTVSVPQVTVGAVKPVEPKIYTVDELLAEANRLRAEKGVAPLRIDERLNQSAQWKADDMKEFGYFGHVKPGETGTNGTQKAIDLVNHECMYVSENLQWGNNGNSPFTWWTTSEKHYTALINARYETTGFGYAYVKGMNTYVQHFCDIR